MVTKEALTAAIRELDGALPERGSTEVEDETFRRLGVDADAVSDFVADHIEQMFPTMLADFQREIARTHDFRRALWMITTPAAMECCLAGVRAQIKEQEAE